MTDACDMLKVVGLQAWTQPLRNDATDNNVVSIERFRNHVWWVGGNALAYRSLLPVAAMYSSVPMVDLLAEVCQRSISMTSQVTYEESFWTEGFTADGAGWGHGMQCLVWGYPIDGASNALNMLTMLRGTPWAQQLDKTNTDALMNFSEGEVGIIIKVTDFQDLIEGHMFIIQMKKYPICKNVGWGSEKLAFFF